MGLWRERPCAPVCGSVESMKHKSSTGSSILSLLKPCGSVLFNCHRHCRVYISQTIASTRRAHLHVASKGVVAVELAHVSIAGVFHFSVEQNVSGEQGHFGTHVHPIDDLSHVAVLRLP